MVLPHTYAQSATLANPKWRLRSGVTTHPCNHAFPAYKHSDVSGIDTSPVKHSNVLAPNKLTLILAFNFWTARRRMLRTVYTVPCEGNTLKRRSKICPVSCECSLIQSQWYRCITGILRWSYELGEWFTDVHYHMLGTLSNYDDDNNNNAKKQLVLWLKQLCTCITLFSTFFDVHCTTTTWNLPRRRFMEHVDIRRQMFVSLFEHGYSPYKNSTPGKDAYIWRIERFQIDAIKFERTQIHFFGDVFTAVVLVA